MYVLRNIEVRSCNHCCSGKAISITYYECVSVALGIQHAPYCQLWLVWLYYIFPHYLINGTINKKQLLNTKLFWFSLQPSSDVRVFHIIRIIQRNIIINVLTHVEYPIFLSDVNEIWIFWADFRKVLNTNFLGRFSKSTQYQFSGQIFEK
jgi:hypothetical protein